jgi:hypothetical protein
MVRPLLFAEAVTAATQRRRRGVRWLGKRLSKWLARHRHPVNFVLHMIGIPLAVAGLVMFFLTSWYWALGAILFGYVLQYVGHTVEGNDVGEWAGIKRFFGLPYVAVSPRWHLEEGTQAECQAG